MPRSATIHDHALRADAGIAAPPLAPPLAPPRRVGGKTVYTMRVARVHGPGDPLRYPWGAEYRDESEVERIARQLGGVKVVHLHPSEDDHGGSIRDGARAEIVGEVQRAWVDGGYAMAEFATTRDFGDDVEISLGYGSVLDARHYQRDVDVDHVAIVPRGRCGPSCRLRADDGACCSSCAVGGACYSYNHNANRSASIRGEIMPDPVKTDSETVRQLATQLATAEQKLATAEQTAKNEKLRADTAEGKLIEIEKKAKDLEAQVAGAQTAVDTEALQAERKRADAAEEKVSQFDKVLEDRIRERVALERTAAIVLPELKMDKLSDRQIRCAVVKHCDAQADVSDGVADGVIIGRFLTVTAARAEGARAQARIAEITATQTRADAKQERQVEKRNRWKQPLPNALRAKGN